LRDLRVSITDRCNFRCLYCLPETEAARNFYRGKWAQATDSPRIAQEWLPKSHVLSYEEIERLVRLVASLGIQKIRITGGEPLLRRNVDDLVRRIAPIPGILDLAMTTNGFQFAAHAQALGAAGLKRVSFSLDSLERENFKKITGRDGLPAVLDSIAAAQREGFHPIKVNAVVIRGLNDAEIPALVEFAAANRVAMRFIEFMPLDSARAWQRELVVSGEEILARVRERFDVRPIAPTDPSSTSVRYSLPGGDGELGIIAPVTQPFCGHCNRLRLTADGKIRTCLFSLGEHDVRSLLRSSVPDEEIAAWFRAVVLQKEARHHIGEPEFVPPSRSMSCIGG
jgi:cyclic pyranopterin phosphate synthase